MVNRGLFFILMLPFVVVASLVVSRYYKHMHFDELIAELQNAPVLLPRVLHRTSWLCGCANRYQRLLPPFNLGPCLKHSLVTLRLLAWCGIKGRLHLGMMSSNPHRQHHAWISIDGEKIDRSAGYTETWVSQ
jgi:hypothetical protein